MSCCKEAITLRTAIIKRCRKEDHDPNKSAADQKWCLYSKKSPGKLLGRHPSKESAKKQEAAIQINKHGETKMSSLNEIAKNLRKIASVEKEAEGWENLPKGWTESSARKFWNSLTGEVKHKITKCMKQMEGKVSDPGAFCASLKRKLSK